MDYIYYKASELSLGISMETLPFLQLDKNICFAY